MKLPLTLTETPTFDSPHPKQSSMELPKTLTSTPTFEIPFVSIPPLQAHKRLAPPLLAGAVSDFDSDGDGVIDPWDCQPFNPDEDGFFGDLVAGVRGRISAAREYVRPDYGRAARRRQAVRQRVSGGARQVTRTIRRGAAGVERRTRPARRTVKRTARQVSSRLPIHPSASRAKERRAAVATGVMGAPKRILTGISERGKPLREKMESQIARVTARKQAKFDAPGIISGFSRGFHEKASHVATTVRRFETDDQVAPIPDYLRRIGAPGQFIVPGIEPTMQRMETRLGLQSERIPEPIRAAGGAAKSFVYGATLRLPAGIVEVVGMTPVAVEAMRAHPGIIPMSVAVGAVEMGKGVWHGVKTDPAGLAGELWGGLKLMKGGGKVADPYTPKIIRGEGYTGVGIKGRTKPAYEVVDVPATPKEFLKSEIQAGRIKGGVQQKPFTEYPAGTKKPFGTARIDVGEPAAITRPTEIFVAPKTYVYSAVRKIADPLMKLKGTDIYQQRRFRAEHPTHQEVLAHELTHHKSPQFSEGKVMRLTREFAEAPSKKIFTIPKQVKVGYTYTPKPIIGLRTAKSTTPAGVTTTYKGIQIGKGWTPAEIIKTQKMESVTGIEGTELAMQRQTQARLGQFRYERTGFARGHIDPGYFLPKGKPVPKPQGFPELMTGERGLTVTGRHLPSVDVIKPPPLPKPTRVYAEIKQPYAKAADIPLAGSPARLRWIEAGFRKVSYGVKGGPKQPRIEIAAEPWGYHPTYPPGIAGGTAAVPSYLTGYTPKRIATGMYFHPEGAPSSRVATIEDILRPKTTGIRPPKVSAKSARPKPVSPRAEPVRAAEPMRGPAPEPARPRPIVGEPEPMLAPKPAPVTPKRRVTFAEPEASPVLEAMLKDAKTAGTEVMQTGATCPIFDSPRAAAPSPTTVPARPPTTAETLARPRTATEMLAQQKMPVDAFVPKTEPVTKTRRKPKPIYAGVAKPRTTPVGTPSFTPAPEESEEEEKRRKWFIMHTPDPSTEPVPDPTPDPYPDPDPDPYPDPQPDPTPDPDPDPQPDPTPDPWEYDWTPPPGGRTPPPPPPPPPIILKPDRKDKKKPRRRKTPGKRTPFGWFTKHDLITLESFLGEAGKAPASGKFPEPDLGVPKL